MSVKELAKSLQKDYIPKGRKLSTEEQDSLMFRPTKVDEVYQCVCPTSYDPQSGRIYCGQVADFIASVTGGIVPVCKRHSFGLNKTTE